MKSRTSEGLWVASQKGREGMGFQLDAGLQEQKDKRDEWARHMRRLFSPPLMLNPDGSIDQMFFKPKARNPIVSPESTCYEC